MATNKQAIIRYHALDQCFSNSGRKYFIDDLLESCNNAIYTYTGTKNGVKRRQIFEDIKFMESDQGWSIPLEKIREGKRVYYKYSNTKFSIKQSSINESEANQIKETLTILSRFKGMPQFNWIEELLIRLETTFNLKQQPKPIIGFEQNVYLKGLEFFNYLFNALFYKIVLNITYKSYRQKISVDIELHPYFLKQYNNRWFLFGYNEKENAISNLALDRIISINEINKNFIENQDIDFEEYFDDIIGVTVKSNLERQKILLQISNQLWPYIESKPIHGSQKVKQKNDESIIIELNLQINFEFISLIFSYGSEIKIIAPESLKNKIIDKAEKLLQQYI